MRNLYEFEVRMTGWGESVDEAWENCKEFFDIDKEELPNYEIIDREEI